VTTVFTAFEQTPSAAFALSRRSNHVKPPQQALREFLEQG
jgi:hypothetical protein